MESIAFAWHLPVDVLDILNVSRLVARCSLEVSELGYFTKYGRSSFGDCVGLRGCSILSCCVLRFLLWLFGLLKRVTTCDRCQLFLFFGAANWTVFVELATVCNAASLCVGLVGVCLRNWFINDFIAGDIRDIRDIVSDFIKGLNRSFFSGFVGLTWRILKILNQ